MKITKLDNLSSVVQFDGVDGIFTYCTLEGYEKNAIESYLRMVNGNKSNCAKILGIDRRTLYRKIAKYGITD